MRHPLLVLFSLLIVGVFVGVGVCTVVGWGSVSCVSGVGVSGVGPGEVIEDPIALSSGIVALECLEGGIHTLQDVERIHSCLDGRITLLFFDEELDTFYLYGADRLDARDVVKYPPVFLAVGIPHANDWEGVVNIYSVREGEITLEETLFSDLPEVVSFGNSVQFSYVDDEWRLTVTSEFGEPVVRPISRFLRK